MYMYIYTYLIHIQHTRVNSKCNIFQGVGKSMLKCMLQYYYDVYNLLGTCVIQLTKYVLKFCENAIIYLLTTRIIRIKRRGSDPESTSSVHHLLVYLHLLTKLNILWYGRKCLGETVVPMTVSLKSRPWSA